MKTLCGIGFFCAALLTGCSSADHPNTTQAVGAHNRVQALADQEAWARAEQANTVQALQNYLQEQAGGSHVAAAKERLAANERLMAWMAASAANTVEALEGFLEKYPHGPHASTALARLAQITGYRVQLASLRSEKQAEKIRERLQGKYGDVLGSVVIVPGETTSVHVVRSATMGEGEANTACARLKKDHLSCEVIKDVNS